VQVTLATDPQTLSVEVIGVILPAREDSGFDDGGKVACKQAAYGAGSDDASTIDLCHLGSGARVVWQASRSAASESTVVPCKRLVSDEY
jgi:hypothetical protein